MTADVSSSSANRADAYTITQLAKQYRDKKLSPVEYVSNMLTRIERSQAELNAYVTVSHEQAMASAKQAEKHFMKGDDSDQWLLGIPLGIKDVIFTRNLTTTMGCEIFKNFKPDLDATVVSKLKASGGVVVGKTNAHQFAFGITGDKSHIGPPRNPYDPSKITGGSSGGSGAAVSANLCTAAVGTDTGGSIRIPAACCGIVGLKPTYGLVSKFGVYPLSYTFDHVGPMSKTVEDNAILLNSMRGFDANDEASVRRKSEDYTRRLQEGIKGTTIGVPASFIDAILDDEIRAAFHQAVRLFETMGAKIKRLNFDDMTELRNARRTVQMCEAYTVNEKHIQLHPEMVDDEIRRRFSGFEFHVVDYIRAVRQIPQAKSVFMQQMKEVDVLLMPVSPILPPDIGQREIEVDGKTYGCIDQLTRYMWQANLTGFPALSVPCGFSSAGLPIGIQLMGRPFDEANLYRFAHAFEIEQCL